MGPPQSDQNDDELGATSAARSSKLFEVLAKDFLTFLSYQNYLQRELDILRVWQVWQFIGEIDDCIHTCRYTVPFGQNSCKIG